MRKRIRVSTISYLNTVPLTWSLLRQPPENFTFDSTIPSRCADDLAAGRADVGIIPSIEYQRIPGLSVLAGPCIASLERVRSILLLSNKPLEQVKTVAADTSSRTSVALANILLRKRYGVEAKFVSRAPDPVIMLRECDAAVVIGDPALHYSLRPIAGVDARDMVVEWRAWTGLPFVFAFWAARSDVADPELARVFSEARDRGVAAIREYAAAEARKRGLPLDLVVEYLSRNIHYDLDGSCRKGLERFYQLASELGIVGRVAAVNLVEPAAVGATKP